MENDSSLFTKDIIQFTLLLFYKLSFPPSKPLRRKVLLPLWRAEGEPTEGASLQWRGGGGGLGCRGQWRWKGDRKLTKTRGDFWFWTLPLTSGRREARVSLWRGTLGSRSWPRQLLHTLLSRRCGSRSQNISGGSGGWWEGSLLLTALGKVSYVRAHILLVKYSTGQSWIWEAPCAEAALVAPVEEAKPHSWSRERYESETEKHHFSMTVNFVVSIFWLRFIHQYGSASCVNLCRQSRRFPTSNRLWRLNSFSFHPAKHWTPRDLGLVGRALTSLKTSFNLVCTGVFMILLRLSIWKGRLTILFCQI